MAQLIFSHLWTFSTKLNFLNRIKIFIATKMTKHIHSNMNIGQSAMWHTMALVWQHQHRCQRFQPRWASAKIIIKTQRHINNLTRVLIKSIFLFVQFRALFSFAFVQTWYMRRKRETWGKLEWMSEKEGRKVCVQCPYEVAAKSLNLSCFSLNDASNGR